MSRISRIFTRVRDSVNDPRKERWSDEGFMRLLWEGLDDISKQTKMFNAYTAIPLIPGIATYELPKDLIELTSINYEGNDIPLKATSFMNKKFGHNWLYETSDSNIKCAVFDNQFIHTLKVFPRPFFTPATVDYEFDPSVYGFDVGIENLSSYEDLYGVINLITSSKTLDIATDLYGVLSEITEGQVMLVSYIRAAKHPVSFSDDFELPTVYDVALKHFIIGMVLRQDLDQSNRAMGGEELDLYMRELATIITSSTKDHANGPNHEIQYNGIG